MSQQVIAIIPARGQSKRLPRKNLYPYFGKPLLQWAVEACQASAHIDEVYVSTEDAEIKIVAQKLGATVINRPVELAADTVWTQEVLKQAVAELEKQGKKINIVVRIQANSPQVESSKIDEAIDKLLTGDRWEIFSVDQAGYEDAAIHVMRRNVVFQAAFSVYKGVIHTDYVDIHTAADVERLEAQRIQEIEQLSHEYLQRLHDQYLRRSWRGLVPAWAGQPRLNLWLWQTQVPLHHRWQNILKCYPPLKQFLTSPDCYTRAQQMRVLDLGSGFGMYWPILREYGFRKFVGIDLFDMRGRQFYLQAARQYVEKFCPDCETRLIMDDVRNLSNHQLLTDRFDVVLAVATISTKLGATGIPRDLFDSVVQQYGTAQCTPVYAGDYIP